MLCLRCIRGTRSVFQSSASSVAQLGHKRAFGALSSHPIRPTLAAIQPATPATELQSTTLRQPTWMTGLSISQVRGAKRDTFKPSHVVRKRRHGFLSRAKTRTGRATLKRRRAKNRTTLSH